MMKKHLVSAVIAAAGIISTFTSCGTTAIIDYSTVNAPEEAGIVFTRITPEGATVIASTNKISNYLALNNKGDKLAYLSRTDADDNIYTLDLSNRNISQQRTYRNNVTGGFCFSPDDEEILFNSSSDILSTNAAAGAICRQITSGWWPCYSPDGKYVFLQRSENNKQFLWRYTVANKEMATLCAGSGVTPAKEGNTIYFLRSLTRNGRTFQEIRKFNYETGNDEVILSNDNISPSTVHISPDGKWLLFAANKYDQNKRRWSKLNLFVVRTDGTELTQLTFHQGQSLSPVWSADGKSIYFISGRGNTEGKWGIWSMNFTL